MCSVGEEPVKITKEASMQRQVLDEVLKKRASKKRELTQIIKHSLEAIWPKGKCLMF